MKKVINLQSDLMNMPSDEMWQAMGRTKIGWVIDREDETVNKLERESAKLLEKEAALFVLTGRMACLIALMTLCERGNQVIMEEEAHIAWSQEWGLSYICGLYPKFVKGKRGIMDPLNVEKAIIDSRFKHVPKTDLLCLENTHNMAGGAVLNVEQTKALAEMAHHYNVKVFIDGCRLFYASQAINVRPSILAEPADAVVISLIKGLGGHGGALLCGSAELIEKAYKNLTRIGAASFHRAGYLAASGLVALRNINDLGDDIKRAKKFAESLNKIKNIEINISNVETNIVMVEITKTGMSSKEFLTKLKKEGVLGHQFTVNMVRFTFHRDISDDDVYNAIEIIYKTIKA